MSFYGGFFNSKGHVLGVKAKAFIGGVQKHTFTIKKKSDITYLNLKSDQILNLTLKKNYPSTFQKLKTLRKKCENYVPENYLNECYTLFAQLYSYF